MNTIWKYPLKVEDYQQLNIPDGGQILTVQVQNGIPCVWAKVNPASRLLKRGIFIVGTGHRVSECCGEHVGTFQIADGALIFHVFEEK